MILFKVLELSASDDAEALLISKMKQACGYEYTNKLQNMYQDIVVSKNLANKFRENIETSERSLEIDFRIKVLTQGSWPLSNDISVNLPIELIPVIDRFTAFYYSQHSSRKLMWVHKLSKAELIMDGLKQRYYIKVVCTIISLKIYVLSSVMFIIYFVFFSSHLQANTLQTAVLLHYNEQAKYSAQQLVEYTGIEHKYMMALLESMIKMKLLKRSSNEQGTLCETSNIEVNTAYNEYVFKSH